MLFRSFKAFLLAGDLTDGVESSEQYEYGAGLINAVKAMDAALSGGIPAVMAGSPSVLTFDQSNTDTQLTLNTYPSSANITITSINTGVDWLEIGPELKTGEAPPATVTVGINTALLDQNNSFATDLQIEYDGDGTPRTLTVPVNVRLIDPNDTRNAGRHYVLWSPRPTMGRLPTRRWCLPAADNTTSHLPMWSRGIISLLPAPTWITMASFVKMLRLAQNILSTGCRR